ncbi:hypothetical protein H7849_06340 [Alloacidobacterium dinghuense]|uniref:Response regulatory domain-containing protein n=1 Tax=Alloacidobacterium dinghuense TaxID=2763107 RepID=A0A7G8BLY9_9BACT|nr:hypothetical protein [Alloacidobacterium dinghuense]QNI33559.1 hypothetical protein H7849_06340 [Alloacidobacterium dinghuense]
MDERQNEIRILAVVSDEIWITIARQLAPLHPKIERAARAAGVARLVNDGKTFEVAILPAELPNAEWWAVWGEISSINPCPAILVYTRSATFELWTSVLDLGGYDLIVEPFSDQEIQEAVHRAAQSFRDRLESDAATH